MTRIIEIGEFPLIDRLKEIISIDRPDIIVGIGDDVAVLANTGDHYLLATVDAQVENEHCSSQRIMSSGIPKRKCPMLFFSPYNVVREEHHEYHPTFPKTDDASYRHRTSHTQTHYGS